VHNWLELLRLQQPWRREFIRRQYKSTLATSVSPAFQTPNPGFNPLESIHKRSPQKREILGDDYQTKGEHP
jgi:hypothetical protein